ncbi:putative L-type lectin-domain containing receptor kinase S.5 [Silene latifolia]|uniref:putative L-type lectin-domain containing receptor kinase S.5 n=1 Tax=Silene latifolia TaxID=37657 RepID=UPI003D776A9D
MYHKKFKLSNNGKVADFNSTFVINTKTSEGSTGGEGLAFILAKYSEIPDKSHGQWLGIVNASTNGLEQNSIVAIEFDTKKSFPEDIDGNHVGLNINSVYSNTSVSLNSSNIRIASGNDTTGMIMYNGTTYLMDVYVVKGNTIARNLPEPIISMYIDLRDFLPNDVYIGFSASTGLSTELNCVKSWFFVGSDLDDKGSSTLWVKVTVSVSVSLSVVLILSLAGVFLYRRRKLKRNDPPDDDGNTISGIETGIGPKKIKLKDIKEGTGNFNIKNKLGSGGFGIVYLGILDGIEVAVKRIDNTPAGKQNLIAEVTTIGSLHHKNLVRLIGWCHENNELILVYEYMPNRSLDYYIHIDSENQNENKTKLLSWEIRHNIVCGVAQALDYLHNECSRRVLHRDIKASNIMLDSDFNACLGDFGLARMFSLSETSHHSTKEIAGTPGYMAPEIFHTGRATSETDVYAFGVLALVVACGKKAVFETKASEYRNSIVDWVWELYNLDTVLEAIDAKLEGKFEKVQAEFMLVLGLACCHPNPSMRPSMRNALQVLMGESLPPLVPCDKPVFIWPATPPSFSCEDSPSGGILTPFSTLDARF